ncbi:MAG: His/Gly/Thr/Pro-type tRNA ligase C-terminal domain-containing protein, partial [Candidatus Methanomethylophilaceae archaeon]|nr:His/Gly/Thr/Pro-type tRNA ligase C-terminal domain-containing protein [Candidatus Methanomethylophilaceae archaeon]
TGMVFEAEAPVLGAEKQICGGGSYSLSELFGGEKVFSTGFAIGFDRVLLALEKEGKVCSIDRLDAYVVPVSDEVRPAAFKVLTDLRKAGLNADIDLMRRKMGKALKHASSLGAQVAVIVGSTELEQGAVTIRDMNTGEQSLVTLDAVSDYLRN